MDAMDVIQQQATQDRSDLLHALRQHSVKFAQPGEAFTLASGKKSNVYVDCKKTILRNDIQSALARAIMHAAESIMAANLTPDAYAGVVLGGCHMASLAAFMSARDVVFVRKEAKDHGTKNLVEYAGTPGSVVLVEDVVTTGGSSARAITALAENGFDVRGVVALIDRREAPAEDRQQLRFAHGACVSVAFRAIFRLFEFVDGYGDLSKT